MKADEIRNEPIAPAGDTQESIQESVFFLREIAAQLAELNETLRILEVRTRRN